MAPLRIIIIGGGLAGACLGNGLLNHGGESVQVAVFERHQQGDERGGYQIRLGAYALAGFKACLTPEQFQEVLSLFGRSSYASSAPCVFEPSTLKVMLDLSKAPTYEKSAPIARMRLREFLQQPLRRHNVIRYGMKFTHYESLEGPDDGLNPVRVHFADGTYQDCDILISAEGSGSKINKQIGLNNILENDIQGHVTTYGKCSLSWPVLQSLPKQLLEKGTIYTANSKAAVFSAIYLPHVVAPSSDATKGKDQAKPINYDEKQASMFVGVAWYDWLGAKDLAQVKDKKELIGRKLAEADFHPSFQSLIDALDERSIIATPQRFAKSDTPVDWRRRICTDSAKTVDRNLANPRVWLIGDAIHAMLPNRGMGANNAIRDTADVLEPLLKLAKQNQTDGYVTDTQVRDQLTVFENIMLPRAMAWVKKSEDQALPDLGSIQGKAIVTMLNVMIFFLSSVVKVMKVFGWTPKDDAPELV